MMILDYYYANFIRPPDKLLPPNKSINVQTSIPLDWLVVVVQKADQF